VAEGTPAELKRLVPGGHIRLEFATTADLERAAARFDDARADAEALALDVPTDGAVASLRAVLDELDRQTIPVDDVALHTPDLDDVFLSLTGQSEPNARPRTEATR
jgi:ABC-2 type transport system ATP-binding protein